MNLTKILEDLRRERQQIDEAIFSLERLASGAPRRGRPPAWLKNHKPGGRLAAAPKERPAASKEKAAPAVKSASGD
ncbi:MAG TPA: hypothetical protein VJN43_13815 [Bryobacteraceae bacterium]|nr:hypothetical protein [Bryobacteraceae bacterium]